MTTATAWHGASAQLLKAFISGWLASAGSPGTNTFLAASTDASRRSLARRSPGPPLLVTSLRTSQCPSGLVGDLHLEVAGTSWSAAWASLRKNRLAAVGIPARVRHCFQNVTGGGAHVGLAKGKPLRRVEGVARR